MMKLPISNFEWMREEEIEKFDILSADLDGDTGYFIEDQRSSVQRLCR